MSSDKIKKICEYMDKNKMKNYPIQNNSLEKETDYIKNGYLKMLAVILHQTGEISKAQKDLFARMVEGANLEYELTDYLRQALEIEISDYIDFTSELKEKELKYRFILDAILLSTVSETHEEQLRLVAGFIESLIVNTEDVKYICLLAKSILEQNTKMYLEAEKIRPKKLDYKYFLDYSEMFVSGIICYTDEQLCVQSVKKAFFNVSELNVVKNKVTISSKNVYLKNIAINLAEIYLEITGSENVIIENCEITGRAFPMELTAIQNIKFKNCVFEGFRNRTIIETAIKNISFEKCKFVDCYYYYQERYNSWSELGGVLYTGIHDRNAENVISECEFINCGGINREYCFRTAVLCNCRANVSKTKFKNCWHYNFVKAPHIDHIDPNDRRRTLFLEGTKNKDNEIVGSADFSEGNYYENN